MTDIALSGPALQNCVELRNRAAIYDNSYGDAMVVLTEMKSDPLWECDFMTGSWLKRTSEYFAARAEAEAALLAQREAAEIALGVALLKLAPQLPPQEDGPCAPSVAGVGEFEEVMTWEPDWSGRPRTGHKTSGEAISDWCNRMLAYAATHSGDLLWWRERPEIEGWVSFNETAARWRVYSRLLIGNVSDTTIERIRRGEVAPHIAMINDHVVTPKQLEDVGYTYDSDRNEWSRAGWAYDVSVDQWRKAE